MSGAAGWGVARFSGWLRLSDIDMAGALKAPANHLIYPYSQ